MKTVIKSVGFWTFYMYTHLTLEPSFFHSGIILQHNIPFLLPFPTYFQQWHASCS